MYSTAFIDKPRLHEIFRNGRFQQQPTMTFVEIYGMDGYPVEAVIGDREQNPLGTCWMADLEELLSLAEEEGDGERANPNIGLVKAALKEMQATRERVVVLAKDIERQKATTVVPFKPRPVI